MNSYLAFLDVDTLSNTVDLLVHFRSVVVTLLTSPGNSEGHSARMPRTNTGDLAETLVSLAGQFLSVPSGSHT